MSTKLTILYVLAEIVSVIVMAVALFWSAGRIDWWAAWAAIAVMSAYLAAMGAVLFRFNPALVVERMIPPKGAKAWDRALMSVYRLTTLARYIVAGLDQRYGWTGGFPAAAQIAALVVCVLGWALFVWATASNTFFSQVVRIQSERRHAVARSGPYRYVRHPAYIGAILSELSMGILLDSWWALAAGGLCALMLILRTVLEDRTLQAELPGYGEYARQVRYRLLPGIW